ncbi:MAG: TolC family outer membrane protein [Betaproteobacteria bacterium]|nr:TolC family outer membrane protein [Betaproteobacteria bacterium]
MIAPGLLAAALALLSLSAAAADLVEVLRRAQSSDATYAAARASWQAAQEKIPQGLALLLPNASITANTQYNDRKLDFRNGISQPGKFNNNSIAVSVSQPLYRLQNKIQYDQAKVQVAQADVQLSLALQDLILRVAQAYFDILLAQDNVELARSQKIAIGEQLAQAKRNFEVGTATITDTHEAQARYDLVTAQEIAALNELQIRKRALQQIIGAEAPPIAPLGSKLPLVPPDPTVMDTWVEIALDNSLQVQIQRAAEEFAVKEVERNRAAHYPTVDVVGSYTDAGTGSGNQGGVGFDTRQSAIGLQFALPLYQGGAVNSRVREAMSNLERARQDLESARRTAALNTRQAFLGVTSGIAQVKALESAVMSSQSQLDSTRLGQEVGVRTGVDVLNAQQQLYSAQRDLAQARYNYILSHLRLLAASGRLDEEDVARASQALAR